MESSAVLANGLLLCCGNESSFYFHLVINWIKSE